LVSRRYERGSIAVTSNRGFEQWGEILGDAMVAAALSDRLVHHATMITLKGKSYRLRERGTGTRARRSGSVATRLRLSGGQPLQSPLRGAPFDA
jgi:IstB-like ATP binding protein